MTATTQPIAPLRQRMIDDMRMRQLSPKTQASYVRTVRQFAGFLGRSPDTATVEDLRRYQLHLVDHGTSPVSLNAAITGLQFLVLLRGHGRSCRADGQDAADARAAHPAGGIEPRGSGAPDRRRQQGHSAAICRHSQVGAAPAVSSHSKRPGSAAGATDPVAGAQSNA